MNFHDLRLCNLNLVFCTDKTSTLLLLPTWISALWGTNLNFLVEAAWSPIDILLILEEISMNFMHNSSLIVILMVRVLCSMLEKIFHQTLSNTEPTETLIKSTWLKHSLIDQLCWQDGRFRERPENGRSINQRRKVQVYLQYLHIGTKLKYTQKSVLCCLKTLIKDLPNQCIYLFRMLKKYYWDLSKTIDQKNEEMNVAGVIHRPRSYSALALASKLSIN